MIPAFHLRFLATLAVLTVPYVEAASILTNGDFKGSLSSWTVSGVLFNTGESAVFSDPIPAFASIFQSGSVEGGVTSLNLSFDFFNRLSQTVSSGFVPDVFFGTLYLGASPFGPTLAGGTFDQAIGLFDLDSSGPTNVAPGAVFSASPKGAGWTRFTLSQTTVPSFSGPGFVTVAFEFYNLNGIVSDSVAAVDNVSLSVVPEPGQLYLFAASICLLMRRRRVKSFLP